MKRPFLTGTLVVLFLGASVAPAPAQIGERIDRALDRIGEDIRGGWEEARGAVNKMGVQGRVYSRVHWDKDLQNAAIDIEVPERDVVLLRGSVANAAAKRKAVQLANDTVGVARVIDELAVAEADQTR